MGTRLYYWRTSGWTADVPRRELDGSTASDQEIFRGTTQWADLKDEEEFQICGTVISTIRERAAIVSTVYWPCGKASVKLHESLSHFRPHKAHHSGRSFNASLSPAPRNEIKLTLSRRD